MKRALDLFKADENQIKRERAKAREIRKKSWWKNKIGQGICYYCNQKFAPSTLTMDHIVPISRGGKSQKGNVVPCCKECNNQKKYLTPSEMLLLDNKD